MDDETAAALLAELQALRAEVAELKKAPPVANPMPMTRTDPNGHDVAVSSGYSYAEHPDVMAYRYVAEFELPMRLAGIDQQKRPNLANIFANIPEE